jgi:carboxypeptidase Taq
VTAAIGFDYNRGRLDRSVHPFCSGSGSDTRLTTRFDVNQPLQSLFGSIHEAGHGMYEQGLPAAHFGTALGEYVGMGVHESQSRLWENQVSRSRAFWKYWEPKYRAFFPEQLAGLDSDALYLAINAVQRQPIRVESDEVMYNLHIMLRFRLERAMFNGDLAVNDLPGAWKELAKSMLGLDIKHDAEGCLQDIHWSGGAFGYFPSYCLGNMIGAQLWEAARRAVPKIDDELASTGGTPSLLKWLRQEVHSRGKQLDTPSLVLTVTGESLSPKALLRYLKGRYGPLYQVS